MHKLILLSLLFTLFLNSKLCSNYTFIIFYLLFFFYFTFQIFYAFVIDISIIESLFIQFCLNYEMGVELYENSLNFDPVRDAIETNRVEAAASSTTGGPSPNSGGPGGPGGPDPGVVGWGAGSRTITDEVADYSEAYKGNRLSIAGIKDASGRGNYNYDMALKFKTVKSHHPEPFLDSRGHEIPLGLKYVNDKFISELRSLGCNCPRSS